MRDRRSRQQGLGSKMVFFVIVALVVGAVYGVYVYMPLQLTLWRARELAQRVVNLSHYAAFRQAAEMATLRRILRDELKIELDEHEIVFDSDSHLERSSITFSYEDELYVPLINRRWPRTMHVHVDSTRRVQ